MTKLGRTGSFGKMDSKRPSEAPQLAPYERLAPRRAMALKPVGRFALKEAGKVLAKYGLGEHTLIEHWSELAGAHWAGLALPQHLNRRTETLTVRVAGPAALELAHQEAQLVDRINSYCGRRLVKRLKIVQGPLHRSGLPRRRPARRLTASEEQDIDARAAKIADPDLKAALASYGRAIRSREA